MASSSDKQPKPPEPPAAAVAAAAQSHAEWAASLQAYYAAAGHPYAWPAQHLMAAAASGAPYGTPVPFPVYHPGAAMAYYAHASMVTGVTYPTAEAVAAVKGKGKGGGASPEKGSSGAPSGDDASRSGDSGSEESSETRDDDTDHKDSCAPKKRKSGNTSAEGVPSQTVVVPCAAVESPYQVKGRSASKLPVSAPGRAALPNATPNLNIGIDLWSASPALDVPAGQGEANPGLALARRDGVAQLDERELKRERRKQSNRESARRSRLRKQCSSLLPCEVCYPCVAPVSFKWYQMLSVGFDEDVETILDRVPPQRQTLMFSATMPSWIRKLTQKYLKDPVTIDLVGEDDQKLAEGISLYSIASENYSKPAVLGQLIQEHAKGGKCIVFTQTKSDADRLSNTMGRSFQCQPLHGNISQAQRERTLAGFRDGRFNILIATDVAARGLDIPNVDLVIHFELPNSSELFVHRSGRTGRAGKKGTAILMYNHQQSRAIRVFENDIGCKFTELPKINVEGSDLLGGGFDSFGSRGGGFGREGSGYGRSRSFGGHRGGFGNSSSRGGGFGDSGFGRSGGGFGDSGFGRSGGGGGFGDSGFGRSGGGFGNSGSGRSGFGRSGGFGDSGSGRFGGGFGNSGSGSFGSFGGNNSGKSGGFGNSA